ncbi:MAG: NAD(P)-binding domain-containing protein [Gammaproteobacteria bacterium]|nr:NAD(P)-binding domain-containing protein [Gammaproteobacteria bacterium]MDH5304342.1 NAD(P)-binding domain-containing protein [Gammaproteobacteria bacterium]MDH5321413.1 NAD(P)-binding domain-containing protein [Gammaproteobacteria bacterium]
MSMRRHFILTASLILFALPPAVQAEAIALIGTGEVSQAFGPRLAALGHQVAYGSRSPDRAEIQELVRQTGDGASATTPAEAAARADIILLAVPWTAAEEVVAGLGDLSGKIIIDPVNPRVIAEDGYRDFPGNTSNAERIQNLAPRAFVVKAFNTISTDSMLDPDALGFKLSVPIAGNDAAAKKTVAGLVEALGYDAVDVGPVRYAHVIEGLYLLRANTRDVLGVHFEYQLQRRETAAPQTIR